MDISKRNGDQQGARLLLYFCNDLLRLIISEGKHVLFSAQIFPNKDVCNFPLSEIQFWLQTKHFITRVTFGSKKIFCHFSEAFFLVQFCWTKYIENKNERGNRERPRFFDQVGHQTTYICIYGKLWTEPTKIGHSFRKQITVFPRIVSALE